MSDKTSHKGAVCYFVIGLVLDSIYL